MEKSKTVVAEPMKANPLDDRAKEIAAAPSDQVCPIRGLVGEGCGHGQTAEDNCIGIRCAWYDNFYRRCAVLSIAKGERM